MSRSRLLLPVAAAGGELLAAVASVVSRARRPAKPLHPRGEVRRATLHRFGNGHSGVPWLDAPGRDDVVIRRSRAAGLPTWLPDVHGLALGVPLVDGRGDLLLASTGLGRASRFMLTAAWRPARRPMTTLLPYRTSTGPLLLAAEAEGPHRYVLSWALGAGPWTAFGHLAVHEGMGDADPGDLLFDPVLHTLPGLTTYDWVARLREPAYRASRAQRSA